MTRYEDPLDAVALLTTGLYVLTTGTKEEKYGMVLSWASPVSSDPPLVMAAVRYNRVLHEQIPRYGCFGINVLPAEGVDLLRGLEESLRRDAAAGSGMQLLQTGAPLLVEALAWLDCRLVASYAPGDHTLFIGRVEAASRQRPGRPMSSQDHDSVYLGKR